MANLLVNIVDALIIAKRWPEAALALNELESQTSYEEETTVTVSAVYVEDKRASSESD